jgi:hypothetical protein
LHGGEDDPIVDAASLMVDALKECVSETVGVKSAVNYAVGVLLNCCVEKAIQERGNKVQVQIERENENCSGMTVFLEKLNYRDLTEYQERTHGPKIRKFLDELEKFLNDEKDITGWDAKVNQEKIADPYRCGNVVTQFSNLGAFLDPETYETVRKMATGTASKYKTCVDQAEREIQKKILEWKKDANKGLSDEKNKERAKLEETRNTIVKVAEKVGVYAVLRSYFLYLNKFIPNKNARDDFIKMHGERNIVHTGIRDVNSTDLAEAVSNVTNKYVLSVKPRTRNWLPRMDYSLSLNAAARTFSEKNNKAGMIVTDLKEILLNNDNVPPNVLEEFKVHLLLEHPIPLTDRTPSQDASLSEGKLSRWDSVSSVKPLAKNDVAAGAAPSAPLAIQGGLVTTYHNEELQRLATAPAAPPAALRAPPAALRAPPAASAPLNPLLQQPPFTLFDNDANSQRKDALKRKAAAAAEAAEAAAAEAAAAEAAVEAAEAETAEAEAKISRIPAPSQQWTPEKVMPANGRR